MTQRALTIDTSVHDLDRLNKLLEAGWMFGDAVPFAEPSVSNAPQFSPRMLVIVTRFDKLEETKTAVPSRPLRS
jgi:hypothetical protein